MLVLAIAIGASSFYVVDSGNVAVEKTMGTVELEEIEVEIAGKDAEIEIARARGIAEANAIINSSLTPEYLQHELNDALKTFAENQGGVVVIPANTQGFSMILDQPTLNQRSTNAKNNRLPAK